VKNVLVRGMAATVETDVTEDMVARLGGRTIHPVLGTAHLVQWMEWAARKLIEPHLAPDEDAVGYRIEMVHLMPCRVGEHFTATAEFLSSQENRIHATVYADGPRGRLAQGTFTQIVLAKSLLAIRFGPRD